MAALASEERSRDSFCAEPFYGSANKFAELSLAAFAESDRHMSSSLFSLCGKTAIVTGATRGIGYAIAIGLAKAGADIIVLQVISWLIHSAHSRSATYRILRPDELSKD